jgi:adenylyl- and sulfurtransferase ThiI
MYKTHKMNFSDMHSCVKVLRQMQQYPNKQEFTEQEIKEFKVNARKYGDSISAQADAMFEKYGFYILAQYDGETNSLVPSEFPITEFKGRKL